MNTSLQGRVALITGANKGIGFEAARQLGKLGVRVLIGARDSARGQAAAKTLADEGLNVSVVKLDVTDEIGISAAAAGVETNEGRLDILVNNAGIGLDPCPVSQLDTAALQKTLQTNFYGPFWVSKAFLPLLRRSDAARIVNVSSSLGSLFHLSDPEWVGRPRQFSAYSISKAALNAMTVLLSAELHGTSAKVNSVEPGYTATDMTDHSGFQTTEQAARVIVKYATAGADGPNGGYFDIHGRLPW